MTLDLLMLSNEPTSVLVERAKLAEASGYDTVWLADERFYREVDACLALFAANTTRVRLGPCVTDPFVRHPALTAMAIATIDEISDGRAVLGIGAGISGFAELGIRPQKPARAIRESIELIRALLSCSLSRGRARFSVPRRRMVQPVGCAGQETGPEDAG